MFETPTVAQLASTLERMLGANDLAAAPPLMPVPRQPLMPVSFAQQRLWFIDQFDPSSASYNIPAGVVIEGELDVEALRRALNEVVNRHETLRTSVVTNEGEPAQVIAESAEVGLPLIDLTGEAEQAARQKAEQMAARQAREPFELGRGPLMRASLMKVAEQRHVFVVVMHHIISDGWSMNVLIDEVTALYGAYLRGEESGLRELEVQYADYAVWQREWLKAEVLEAELSYWREKLSGSSFVLEMATDRARGAESSNKGGTEEFKLSVEMTEGLKQISRTESATLFMTLMAGFKVLLSRYSNQEEVIVGTPIAGRRWKEVEGLIGFFVNTLVMRSEVKGEESYIELLRRVKESAIGAYGHQDVPFEKLVEELQPERDLSRMPIFQVMMVMQGEVSKGKEMEGLRIEGMELRTGKAKFEMMLEVREDAGAIGGSLEYSADLFDKSTINRMLDQFSTLLQAIVVNPRQRVSDLPILTESEQRQLLVGWNQTTAQYPSHLCLHQLFERQVESTPEATAVVFGQKEISYSELNRRANQLAHYLRSVGVGSEVLVGLCVERSEEMIVGLLGILKAGGAYVPIDPAYPKDRIALILDDTQAPVVLTNNRQLECLPQRDIRVLCLDSEWETVADQSEDNPVNWSAPDNLAYVIYTSGSTGGPKGVGAIHRAVTRLVHNTNYVDLSANEIILQNAPLSFDASTFEIWGCLLHGALLVIMPAHTPSLEEIGEVIKRHRVSTMWLTAGLFHLMVNERLEDLRLVRQLLAGGDVLSVPHVERVLREVEGCRVINGYGPTESVTFACCYVMDERTEIGLSVPIGRAISNTRLYVLDRNLKPVPVGVLGELYIGGDGLARGYMNQAQLTAERFVPNPFGQTPGERIYWTGDVVRYRADGIIEFTGRKDFQVKVRGFRIELAEVEVAVSSHEKVKDVAVIARGDESGDKRLVAYVVLREQGSITAESLRAFLNDQLPDYMIPSTFVMLDALPLTPNGKLDRKALPAPDLSTYRATQFVAPHSPLQQIVSSIWADVLSIPSIGIHDSFFDLGGHSLLAIRITARIRHALLIDLPLRAMFETPTVAQLASTLERMLGANDLAAAPPLMPAPRQPLMPVSFAQQRLWFIDQFDPSSASYNIPAGVVIEGELDVEALRRALNEVVNRHETLRTSVVTNEGEPAQAIAESAEVGLTLIDLTGEAEQAARQKAEQMAARQAREPFELGSGPLMRASLMKVAEQRHIFVVVMHHIISDGWSMNVLIDEVTALYGAYSRGEESGLRELEVQYADYAVWQREWLKAEVLEAELSYWREKLSGSSFVLELPTDRARGAESSNKGGTEEFKLSVEMTEGLKQISRTESATLFMTLMAGFKVLLSRYSNQEEVIVGTPIAGRRWKEVEGLIGFFVNTLVMRNEVRGEESYIELLRRVKESAIGAYGHQDVPFEKLVEELQPERDLSRTPIFQVMMVMQGEVSKGKEMEGLRIEGMELRTGKAKFEMMLEVREDAGAIGGSLEYSADLFDKSTVERMAQHFTILLEAIVKDPQARLSELPLMSEAVQRQMLFDWNNTRADYPKDHCIHHLFEEQVLRSPDSIAVSCEGRGLTYCELNWQANQLAHHLQSLGVEPDVLVGICIDRSIEMVVGLLAILKAGGAYLPLDPAYPKDRLAFMMEDARTPVLLTRQRLRDTVKTHVARIVCIDEDWPTISLHSRDNTLNYATPDNMAYAIYTSGSTGVPKGVVGLHRGAVNRFKWMWDAYPFTPDEVCCQKTALGFVDSLWEVFGPMLQGVEVVIIRDDAVKDPQRFVESLSANHITRLVLVPSLLSMTLDMFDNLGARLPDLKYCVTSGEAVPAELCARFQKAMPHTTLLNIYGSSEVSADCTYFDTTESVGANVSIGRPYSNVKIYVLDARQRPVPVGVQGELYVGGVGLARGYIDRPQETAERFIPNPFADEPGERLFRTGDRACYRPDGNIAYLGRKDHQTKIRGFRIEPGEIETILAEHPAVRDVVVLAREIAPAEKRLVGYLVVDKENQPTVNELRDLLKRQVPDYMVPSAFVMMDAFPLTPNGKLNRLALPLPDQARPNLERLFTPARTIAEQQLCKIWADVLKLEKVGVHDNFFELGGDSILSVQVVARARQAGFQLVTKQVFRHQTVAELAAIADPAEIAQAEQHAITGPVPLTPIQRWFFEQELDDPGHFNQSVTLEVKPELSASIIEQAVSVLASHHDALRLRFYRDEAGWEQFNADEENNSLFILVDLSEVSSDEQAGMMLMKVNELRTSLTLTDGPIFRVAYFDPGAEKRARLLIIIHHIAVDRISWGILLEDLQTACKQLLSGEQVRLPKKTSSFKQWAEHLLSAAQSSSVLRELDYWLNHIPDRRQGVPVERADGENSVASARSIMVSLDSEETTALLKHSPQAYRTRIDDLLLSALAMAYTKWADVESLLVDVEGHGRHEFSDGIDVTRTVGWFTTIYPVELKAERRKQVGDVIKKIKQRLREAPRQGIGYGMLRYLREEEGKRLSEKARAEVSYNYFGQVDDAAAGEGLMRIDNSGSGMSRSSKGQRSYALEVSSAVTGGRLRVEWVYSAELQSRERVEELAGLYIESLKEIITHCRSDEAGGYTPSDFPLAGLTEQQLDRLYEADKFIEDVYPLSPMQQGMLFHSLYNPESGVYVTQLGCAIRGDLNVQILERAWQEVVNRNEVLRTGFIWEQLNEPLQVVRRNVSLTIETQEWTGLAEDEQRRRLEEFLQSDKKRGFEMSHPPLMRLTLIKLADDRYKFVWSHHHLLLDGWSIPLVFQQLFAIYDALSQGVAARVERSRPYRDYIEWVRQQDESKAEEFWRHALAGLTKPTLLAGDGSKSTSSSGSGYEIHQARLF